MSERGNIRRMFRLDDANNELLDQRAERDPHDLRTGELGSSCRRDRQLPEHLSQRLPHQLRGS